MARNEPKIYKHSNAKTIITKTIVIFIVAVIVLALTAFFGFRKFIAHTDTGKLYLDIPWLYGYMDGPPAEDPLAPYLEPVVDDTSTPVTKVDETLIDAEGSGENVTTDDNGVPQYVDPNPDTDEGENDDQ